MRLLIVRLHFEHQVLNRKSLIIYDHFNDQTIYRLTDSKAAFF